jgi:P27 family predicted phage terminase small subunit
MNRGPAPQPTALKVLRGNPGKRALNANEPKPEIKRPYCPPYLDEVAKKEWRRLMPILMRMKVLTEADYVALGNLCQAYSTMIKAQQQLSSTGLLLKTPSGYVQQSPLVSIVRAQMEVINRLCTEFGLTPSARTRLVTPEATEKPKSVWSQFRTTSSAG